MADDQTCCLGSVSWTSRFREDKSASLTVWGVIIGVQRRCERCHLVSIDLQQSLAELGDVDEGNHLLHSSGKTS